MNLLRTRYHGLIHLQPVSGDLDAPRLEFLDGEGPDQVLDQIQGFAVPWIRKAVDLRGPHLFWEELDLGAGIVRRHRTSFDGTLAFELCGDERGIVLELGENGSRPWAPLVSRARPGREQRAAVGWSVEKPTFSWRYVVAEETQRQEPPAIEVVWSCPNLHGEWVALVRERVAELGGLGGQLELSFADGTRCRLNPSKNGHLAYRGYEPLPSDIELPARCWFFLQQPLEVVEAGAEDAVHAIEDEVPATVEAHDFRALAGDRPTRLVAREDLDLPFRAEVLTRADVWLPDGIPAGALPGLPWPVAVEAAGTVDSGEADGPELRRFLLTAVPEDGAAGTWREVSWRDGEPPSLLFGLGLFDPATAPRIHQVESRRAHVGWRLEADDGEELLCLTLPYWTPEGLAQRLVLPPSESDYGKELTTCLEGLEERFSIDASSEVAENRILLGPDRWRFYDEVHKGEVRGEALGEVDGYVRWRRPESAAGAGGHEIAPTDWAGGSAPVLLLRPQEEATEASSWGGLYAPETVPWDVLDEVCPEPGSGRLLAVPRSLPPALWIHLWGFVCRYDRHSLLFSGSGGAPQEVTAWIARTGLELFPKQRGFLLRSFSPLHAVRDAEPRVLSLVRTSPRPTLRVGRDLADETGMRLLRIGDRTRLRYQLTEPGRWPELFGPGRIPGTPLRLSERIGDRTVWLALEQGARNAEDLPAGYLLSWDATAGWQLRGFYTHPEGHVELGTVRREGRPQRFCLGGDGRGEARAFRLTLEDGRARWSEGVPEYVSRLVTEPRILEWEKVYFAPEKRPEPLRDYALRIVRQGADAAGSPWVFEFFDDSGVGDPDVALGIRVWEIQEAAAELLTSVKRLGEETEASLPEESLEENAKKEESLADNDAPEEPPQAPVKKVLRADDDDDF